jgi:hypothetical protein
MLNFYLSNILLLKLLYTLISCDGSRRDMEVHAGKKYIVFDNLIRKNDVKLFW